MQTRNWKSVRTTDPSSFPQRKKARHAGAKTSDYSEHGLTLERPPGKTKKAWAVMSNMGKIMAGLPHEEKEEEKRALIYILTLTLVRHFRVGYASCWLPFSSQIKY